MGCCTASFPASTPSFFSHAVKKADFFTTTEKKLGVEAGNEAKVLYHTTRAIIHGAVTVAQPTYLGSNGVRACGEQLGHTGRLEACLHQAEGSAEPRPSSPHHHCIVGVVDHGVVAE